MILKNKKDEKTYKSSKDSTFHFSACELTVKDDGFHGSTVPRFTEWWYFDAVFDNGYSIQVSVRFFGITKKRFAIISQRLDIYKNGELVRHNEKYFTPKKFEAQNQYPHVKLDKKQVIAGGLNKDGNLEYRLFFKVKDASADLIFEGCTKGWKGTNPSGDSWAVFLPRAKVKGILKIKNKEISVQGVGYHDHNWDVTGPVARKNYGWFWGKINSNSFTITWAAIFKNRRLGQPILIINENNGDYTNVNPKEIEFVGSNLNKENGKFIPHYFNLKAKNENVSIDVSMDVKHIHHVRRMLKAHYWRFHVTYRGTITFFGQTENIDGMQMAEFLIF